MLSDTMMLGGGRKAAYSIENALLFRGGQYLKRTPGAGDQMKWTFSCWVKGSFPANGKGYIFGQNDGSSPDYNRCEIQLTSGGIFLTQNPAGSTIEINVGTNVALRDPTAWYHVVVVWDSAQPNASDRVRIFVNGAEVSYSSTAYPMQHKLSWVNASGKVHYIGCETPTWNLTTGYLAEAAFVDGQVLLPSQFGEVDAVTGSWRPKKLTGIEWGTNGFHLGAPWSFTDLGKDYSDRNNTWTPVDFTDTDVLTDSPTNVYAVLNPLNKHAAITLSDGNLTATAENNYVVRGTLPLPVGGAWCWETKFSSLARGSSCGISAVRNSDVTAVALDELGTVRCYGPIRKDGTVVQTPGTLNQGDVIGIVCDMTTFTVQFYRNGVAWGDAVSIAEGAYLPMFDPANSPGLTVNFGQRPLAHSYGAAKSLCTANLPLSATLPTGTLSGSFTGNASADGPCVYIGAVPQALTINGKGVTWGVHADKLATGFKVRTADTGYNSTGTNTWTATYDHKPTVGPKGRAPANAQANP